MLTLRIAALSLSMFWATQAFSQPVLHIDKNQPEAVKTAEDKKQPTPRRALPAAQEEQARKPTNDLGEGKAQCEYPAGRSALLSWTICGVKDHVAFFTFWVALFTLVLAISTVLLWCETKKATQLSHRPRLAVRRIAHMEEAKVVVGVQYAVDNIGDGDATIIATSAKVWLTPYGENLPPIPPYGKEVEDKSHVKIGDSKQIQYMAPAEDVDELNLLFGFKSVTTLKPDAQKTPTFHFLGYVVYLDALGRKRRTAFLRQFDFSTKRFNPINHPEYEYQD